MKNTFLIVVVLVVLGGPAAIELCAQPLQSATRLQREPNPLFLSALTNKIDARLKNKSVGYSFAVVDKSGNVMGGGGGDARRAPDGSPRKMTMNDKINIASVSKTITAAAVMKLLHQRGMKVDDPIHPFLPVNWTLGPNVKSLTFRNLLTHRSGIRCPKEVTYLNLRECLAAGINPVLKAKQEYNNSNFALFRLIIPRLNGFDGGKTADNSIGNTIASSTYAAAYSQYVRNHILAPAGLTGIDTKPAASNPTLAYQFPNPKIAGDSFGDMTETSASRGWVMSARQLATFFHALFNTEKIVPFSVSKRIKDEQLGVWRDATFVGPTAHEHGGHYPGKNDKGELRNQGELNSVAISFSNGVTVAVIVNSQFGPGLSIAGEVKAALKELSK